MIMKKLLLTMLTMFPLMIQGSAQTAKSDLRNNIIVGIKGGANYSWVYDRYGFNAEGRSGIVAGYFFSLPITTNFGIQPELLFAQKNFRATGRLIGDSYDFTRIVSYIEAPVMFAFKPHKMFTILAGPQYSFLIQQVDNFPNGNNNIQQQKMLDNAKVRKQVLGFVAGTDVTINQCVIGLRVGLDIQNNSVEKSVTIPLYKNAWLQGTAGFRFPWIKK